MAILNIHDYLMICREMRKKEILRIEITLETLNHFAIICIYHGKRYLSLDRLLNRFDHKISSSFCI